MAGEIERQLLYLGLIALGLAAGGTAALLWRAPAAAALSRLARAALAAGPPAAALLVAALVFPGDPLAQPYADPALLDRFRAAAIGSQALFWTVLAAAAWWLARPRRSDAG